jgi:hypothetical protein
VSKHLGQLPIDAVLAQEAAELGEAGGARQVSFSRRNAYRAWVGTPHATSHTREPWTL